MEAGQPSTSDKLTSKEIRRVFIVENYLLSNKSPAEVRRRFAEAFPGETPPANKTILETVKKLHDEATLKNLNKGRSGHPKTTSTPEFLERVDKIPRVTWKQKLEFDVRTSV